MFVGGILLFLLGLLFVGVWAGPYVACSSPVGQAVQGFAPVAAACGTVTALFVVAIVFAILGVVLMVLAFALKSRPKSTVPEVPAAQVQPNVPLPPPA
jgi:hypothetical protein